MPKSAIAPSWPARGPSQASLLGIALAAEQQRLAVLSPGHQHQHRLRLGEAAQVPEIAVLAVRIGGVLAADALGRGRQDQDGVLAGHAHQLLAAAWRIPRGLIFNRSRLQLSDFRCRGAEHAVAVQQQRGDAHELGDFGERFLVGFLGVFVAQLAGGHPRQVARARRRRFLRQRRVQRRPTGRSRRGSRGTSPAARRRARRSASPRRAAAGRSRNPATPAMSRWRRTCGPARCRARPARLGFGHHPAPASRRARAPRRRRTGSRTASHAVRPRPRPGCSCAICALTSA